MGKSGKRKKVSSYTSRDPSAAQRQYSDQLLQIEIRFMKEGIDQEVRLSWKWERLTWAMGVTLVAPREVRNEQELAELAHLARKLVLRQTTLDQELPGYVYDRESWLEDQRREPTTFAANIASVAGTA